MIFLQTEQRIHKSTNIAHYFNLIYKYKINEMKIGLTYDLRTNTCLWGIQKKKPQNLITQRRSVSKWPCMHWVTKPSALATHGHS